MSTTADLTAHHKDYTGAKLGMWLFLFTEILLFGGLFILYAVYRSVHAHEFHVAAGELDTVVGTLNTVILLTSSLTMAISIAAIQQGHRKLSLIAVWATVGCGAWFMVNKYFEWGAKFSHGIYPNSEHLLQFPDGEILFFGLYFTMTGLHGLHVLVGMILLSVAAIKLQRMTSGRVEFTGAGGKLPNKEDFGLLENSGLYWHLVDLIWIFLFPLFYLIT